MRGRINEIENLKAILNGGIEELETKGVPELRTIARHVYNGENKTFIARLKKDELVQFIVNNGVILENKTVVPNNGNGNSNGKSDDLADVLAKALNGKINANIDEQRVVELIKEHSSVDLDAVSELINEAVSSNAKTIKVELPNTKTVDVGVQHKDFEKVLKLASMRQDMFLVGAAGSGKTHVCESVAKALDLPFFFQPVGLQTSKTDLLGYTDVNGNYVSTNLRKAYEGGGVFLLDEVDAGNPNVLTVINAMLSNNVGSFPDKMVERHENFIFIAAGNTYGHGGDIQYVGRNQLDAATLDRFVIIRFDYDEELEKAIAGDTPWTRMIQAIRRAAVEMKERLIVSPRASIKGNKMLAAGFSEDECLDMLVFKGISEDVKSRILAKAPLFC